MPHIILEYSADVGDHVEIPDLLHAMHDALADAGIDKARIKTRGASVPYAVVGDTQHNGHMMHATLLLLEGRDVATKQSYGDPIYAAMKAAVSTALPTCAVTLEIRDMSKDTYYL